MTTRTLGIAASLLILVALALMGTRPSPAFNYPQIRRFAPRRWR